ncbi:hypothetical protein IPH19_03700 [Candidatus Uhrbacteria bacterium]|nr:MAG: hypothetical protein IPH19_03700 [Candidatus Uhrbacteria bacterium]
MYPNQNASTQYVATVFNNSGSIVATQYGPTIYINGNNNGSSNDGTNYINGLTLQSDRTSVDNGGMVKLTANAYNAGNWSYVGNRIEIRDVRTGSIVRTCYDQSWCVADVSVQGNNGTAQYEARIYDRNGNFVMSQFGPVIYVNGTSTGSTGTSNNGLLSINANTMNPTHGQSVTITANYSGSLPSNGRITIGTANAGSVATVVQTCYSNPCSYTYIAGQTYNNVTFQTFAYDTNGNLIAYVQPGIYVTTNGSSGSVGQIPNTDIYIAPSTNVRAGGTVYLTASFTNLPYASANTVIRLYTEQSSTPVGTCTGSVSCSVPYTISNSGVNTRVYGVASNSSLGNTIETARIPLATF